MSESYPFGDAVALDLHDRFAELRRGGAPARVRMPYGGEAWLVTTYEQAKLVYADPRFSRAAVAGADVPRSRPGYEPVGNILTMDPPAHGRIRTLVAKAFTARRVELLQPRIQEIVDGLVDQLTSPGDLAETVAWELPVQVICELLGVPFDARHQVRRCTETIVAVSGVTRADVVAARDELAGLLTSLIAQRRSAPGDDLLTALVVSRDAGDRLSDNELLMLGIALLAGGHETTANQIGNFVYQLLTSPERWHALVERPELVPAAVEELLRYSPLATVADLPRITKEDIEIGGRLIRAGDAVLVQADSANRDEQAFPRPDDLDFGRATNRHLTFGFGVHHCIGAPLARLELRVVLATLLRRRPSLRLAVPATAIEWRTGQLMRGVRALPVEFDQ
jgi:cytochrome P450